MTILDPLSLKDMINSLINIYQNEGFLPDCRMSLCKGYTQGGSNADVVIGDAYVKGLPGINWDDAYEAVVQDAEVEPTDWSVEGRGDLPSYKSLGYIPVNDIDNGTGLHTRSISRTIEYAYNDFCIAEMAKGLGHNDDYKKYIARAGNWRNLFLANQTSSINGVDTNFVGFLEPKNLDGSWAYQDPSYCSPLLNPNSCFLNPGGSETYEASIWLYTLYVHPFDPICYNVLI
jgi:putative alpha-1,2-mannosidase